MGVFRETGYSASVRAFFAFNGERIPLAKTNGSEFVLSKPHELSPGTSGDLIVILDGQSESRRVNLPDGVARGEVVVQYVVEAPF